MLPWTAHSVLCLGALVGAYRDERPWTGTCNVDVAIVGAGFSGLSAAENLIKGGRSVAVFEARDRVGGRVLNVPLSNGGVQEVGAEYVGPTQDRVLSLAASLGISTYTTYNDGSDLYWHGSDHRYSSVEFPPLPDADFNEAIGAVSALDAMSATINVTDPWNATSAKAWDSQTLASWFDGQNLSTTARALLDVAVASIWSAEPEEMSLLYVLSYIASAGNATNSGNLIRLITTGGGAQDSRIDGGTQLLAIKLAERIQSQSTGISFNTPVRRIKQCGNEYELFSDDQLWPLCRAKKVVVAMSPPLASRIVYEPLLPASRDQLTQRMPMGALGKAIAIYDTPFWRSQNLSGQVVSTDLGTTVRATFDNSPANASYGAIMGFIETDEMRRLDPLSVDQVKSIILSDYVRYFGPEAGSPTDFVLQRWDLEEWSRGGPVAFAPPGVLTKYGPALRAPFNGIHWAGTETSDFWIGYMDGALRSGERVASEIIAAT